jgi:hypothetical protein
MHLRRILWPLLFVLSAVQAAADARMSVLIDVLRLPEAAQILAAEGLGYADTLNTEMLNGQGGAGWQVQVAAIYDASGLGAKIIGLENSARQAIQDPDVEEAARARYLALDGTDDARLARIERYIETGDMLNRNVASALNSNVQFLRGLADGDAIEMSEEDILADVSGDLEATQDDTKSWLFGFLLLAYHPLTDAELDSYITFSQTAAAQALNRALFDGFGTSYDGISYALGRAVALNMTAQEL